MTVQAGQISVVITADSTELVKESDKAEDKLEKTEGKLKGFGKSIRQGVNDWGKWGAAAAAAGAVAAGAIFKSTISNVRELKNQANAAGLSVEALQRGAFAAQEFGVQQDQYGDILKDVNDRIGDFINTGAGPMVDFFEKIGPKVGVTIDQFKGLNSQQALGLYVQSLEKANLSQAEMTFFMEAMSSESTRLLPLLKNNGEAMSNLTKEAEELGIGLDAVDVEKAIETQRQFDRIAAVTEGQLQQAVVDLAPLITELLKDFQDLSREAGGFDKLILPAFRGAGKVVGFFGDSLRGIEVIFKGLHIAALGATTLITTAFEGVATVIVGVGNKALEGWRLIFSEMADMIRPFSEGTANMLADIAKGIDGMKAEVPEFIKALSKSQNEALRTAKNELHDLAMQPLPSEQADKYFDSIEARAAEATKTIAEETKKQVDANLAGVDSIYAAIDKAATENKPPSVVEAFQNETIGLLEAMNLRFTQQEEAQIAANNRELEILQAQYDAKEIGEAEFLQRKTDLQRSQQELERQMTVKNMQQGFQALASNSKKVQKLMQGIAVYKAVIAGKEAAVHAWNAGMSSGGPFAPLKAAAYAAASIARTGAMISAIKSGGSNAVAAGGGIPPNPAIGAESQSAGGQQPQAGPPRIIQIAAEGESRLGPAGIRALAEELNEAVGDGVEIGFAGT